MMIGGGKDEPRTEIVLAREHILSAVRQARSTGAQS